MTAGIADSDFFSRTTGILVPAAAAYLDSLNPEQQRAVEHGAGPGPCAPLLVIAGAGSGKTNTLAHRVAHLIVQGADPRRILLMTFSRRAASEMTKRVERIARKVLGDNAGIMTDALTWAGTYHGIGGSSNCSQPTSKRSRSRTCSITTTCCSIGPKWSATPAWPTT